jgi:hypothetical protein
LPQDFYNLFDISKSGHKKCDYSVYVEKIKQVSSDMGRAIKSSELQKYKLPKEKWLIKNCPDKNVKTFSQFIEWLGLKPHMKLSKELVTKIIYEKQEKLKRPLLYNDFLNPNNNEIGINMICKIWGNLNNMKKDLGLEIVREDMINKQKTEEEMLNDLKNFINELGRLPRAKEIDKNKNMVNSATYHKYFGSLNMIFEGFGYKPNKKCISLNLTNEEIKQIYYDFIVEDMNGTVPSYDFCGNVYKLPAPITVLRRFKCTWNEFVKSLGFEPNSKISHGETCFAKDGTQCLSIGELVIHNYLLDNINFPFEKEVLYKDIITDEKLRDKCGLKRFDWFIEYDNKKYAVEYFGFMGNKEYNIRHDEKIEIIKLANYDQYFIPIYPKDIDNLDNIFKIFK